MPRADALPAEDRIRRYREMAEHTRTLADKVRNPELRGAYLELAGRWAALADSLQRDAGGLDGEPAAGLRKGWPKSI